MGWWVLLTAVPKQPGTSRLNPLPLSEPAGNTGSVSPPCRRMEMGQLGHACPLPRTAALPAGGLASPLPPLAPLTWLRTEGR